VIQQGETAKWKTFFDSYRKLAYDAAREAGLTDGEAQEVVQDLIKAIAEKTPKSGDHAAKGSFKVIHWRVLNKMRKKLFGNTD
jgi:hypothetical protein